MYVREEYPDVLYLVKLSDDNEELKYSLRSLKNLKHSKVFIVGHKPKWINSNVVYIKTIQLKGQDNKYRNIKNNLFAAISDERLSDDFVLMNDDFFIMKPTKQIRNFYRLKPLEHYLRLYEKATPDAVYLQVIKDAIILLNSWGIYDLKSYDLHIPMAFNKKKFLALSEKMPKSATYSHIRSIYGNYYHIGGRAVQDAKIIYDKESTPKNAGYTSILKYYSRRFLSTIDESFKNKKVGEYIRLHFPEKSVYES